ncbi:MAG TPA: single-stranded DNA-binding protein [Exilispira sp.]|nr:single-stranded DNA-binding protein [Exilispira sp.]
MKDINLAVISGRLTADPLFRETKNGKSFCYFGLASNSFFKKEETWQKEPTFILVKCWNNLAAQTFESLKKGNQVIVYGKLKYSTLETSNNSKRSINFIQAQKIDRIPKVLVKEKENFNVNSKVNSNFIKNKKGKQIILEDNNLVTIEN